MADLKRDEAGAARTQDQPTGRGSAGHSGEEKPDSCERAGRATKICAEIFEGAGLRVSSWEDFPAWQEYVDGLASGEELCARGSAELTWYAKRHGGTVVIAREHPTFPKEEIEKRKRAKRANKVYDQLCEGAGMRLCFFNRFACWCDYVQGRLDESEFYRRARGELGQRFLK